MNQTLNEISIGGGQYGGGFSAVEYEEGLPRYVRITDVTDDGGLNDKPMAASGNPDEWEKYLLQEGDLLFARSGATVGKSYLHNDSFGDAIYAGYMIRFRINQDQAFPRYVFYYTRTPQYKMWVESKQNVVAQPNINAKQYGNELSIPLPPLETQKQIAAILDEADKLRQLNKQLISKYDELTQSLFLDMFGDPVTNPKGYQGMKLGEVCGVGSSKRVFVNELVEEGVPFYRGTEIGKMGNGEKAEPTLFITRDHYKELASHTGVPKKGDLLMPSICPDGRIYIVKDDHEFYFKDGRVLWVKIKEDEVDGVFMRYHLKEQFRTNYLNIASGTTFAELKIVALKNLEVLVPSIEEQKEFAARVQAIELQKAQAEQGLAKAEELFNSLLQRAFKGGVGLNCDFYD